MQNEGKRIRITIKSELNGEEHIDFDPKLLNFQVPLLEGNI